MTISELIAKLQELQTKHGPDVEVKYTDWHRWSEGEDDTLEPIDGVLYDEELKVIHIE